MTTQGAQPVAIIGGGPVGLAAAAHLLVRGETPIVFEAGPDVGANIRQWGHVRMFSPWNFTVDSATVQLLEQSGWRMPPPDELPTGDDLVARYLEPFAQLPLVRPHIRLNARVMAIARRGIDKMKDAARDQAPFILHIRYADGREERVEARAVIDASGTWHNPNPIGASGIPAIGEQRYSDRIFYGIPNTRGDQRARYADKRVLVVGSGHSAINALLDLAEVSAQHPQTAIYWALRNRAFQRIFGGGADDALPARGELGTRVKSQVNAGRIHILAPFRIQELREEDGGLHVWGETADGMQAIVVDEIISATGARPDLDPLRELRLDLDPSLEAVRALAPLIDPNVHSCGTVPPHGEAELRQPERDFYIVGMKSYGRAPTFLLATGYEQVRSIAAALSGDWEAARQVHLHLPETGVCGTDADGGCCGSSSNLLSITEIGVGKPITFTNP